MKTWTMRIGALVLVVAMALSVVASVGAQGPDDTPGSDWHGDRPVVDAIVEAMGLDAQDVQDQLLAGQSLAQIAEANDLDVQTILDTAKATLTDQIDQAVADGNLTQTQADRVLENLDQALDRAMNTVPQERPLLARTLAVGGVRELVSALSDQTGLTAQEIAQQASDGSTLADIAAANGTDADAVVAAALADTTDRLQAQVDAGRITQQQMDDLLAQAQELYPQAMNETLPQRDTPIRDRIQEGIENSLVGVVADAAGVTPRELLREMFQPSTLADVAEAHGLNVDDLISTAETRITDEINQAVADGNLTQDQADQLLSGLHDRLVNRMNDQLQLGGLFDGGRGPQQRGRGGMRDGGMFGNGNDAPQQQNQNQSGQLFQG